MKYVFLNIRDKYVECIKINSEIERIKKTHIFIDEYKKVMNN